jgi:hypothetical protein
MPVKLENYSARFSKNSWTNSFTPEKEVHHDEDTEKKIGAAATVGGGGATAATSAALKKASTVMKTVPLIVADKFSYKKAVQLAEDLSMKAIATNNGNFEVSSLNLAVAADTILQKTKEEAIRVAQQVKAGTMEKQQARDFLRAAKQKLVEEHKDLFPVEKVPRFDAGRFPLAVKPLKMGLIGAVGGLALYGAAELIVPEHKD